MKSSQSGRVGSPSALQRAWRNLKRDIGSRTAPLGHSRVSVFAVAALAACCALLLTDSAVGPPSPPLPPPSAMMPSLINLLTETADPPTGSPSCSIELPERASLGEYMSCPDLLEANASWNERAVPAPTPLARLAWTDNTSAIYMMHDLPIFVSRISASLRKKHRMEEFNHWLLSQETQWRARGKAAGGLDHEGYVLFREAARRGGAIGTYASELRRNLRARFFAFQRQFHRTSGWANSSEARAALRDGVSDDQCARPGRLCTRHAFLTFSAWLSTYHATGPHSDDGYFGRWAGHHGDYRALLVLNASSPVSTGLFSPFQGGRVFSLEHEIGYMVILPGGLKSVAMRPRDGTRPAIALDINIRVGLPLAGNSEDWLAGAKLPKGASLRMWTFQMLYEAMLEMTMETEVSWGGSFAYRDAPPFADEPPAESTADPEPDPEPDPDAEPADADADVPDACARELADGESCAAEDVLPGKSKLIEEKHGRRSDDVPPASGGSRWKDRLAARGEHSSAEAQLTKGL